MLQLGPLRMNVVEQLMIPQTADILQKQYTSVFSGLLPGKFIFDPLQFFITDEADVGDIMDVKFTVEDIKEAIN